MNDKPTQGQALQNARGYQDTVPPSGERVSEYPSDRDKVGQANLTVSAQPASTDELLERAWDQLHEQGPASDDPDLSLLITREQLAGFMADAALAALDFDAQYGEARPTGSIHALMQSLRVMGDAVAEAAPGHAVICRRAVACLERLTNDVTRFLLNPGNVVTHGSREDDLSVALVTITDGGDMRLTCQRPGADASDLRWTYPLAELYPAGPVSDAARIFVAGLAQALLRDALAQMVASGTLKDTDLPERMEGTGGVVGEPGVDHLQAHPEYVIEPGSKHAEPTRNTMEDYMSEIDDGKPPLCGV